MKNLKTLIKLHKNNLDNLVKQISAMQDSKIIIENSLRRLEQEVASESEKFLSTEYGFVLDQYLINARAQKKQYQNRVEQLHHKIQKAQLDLHEEFGETKKLEIALQNRETKVQELEKSTEAKEIDAINIVRYKKQ